jgi:hypothetical protein
VQIFLCFKNDEEVGMQVDADIFVHYYPLAKTQHKWAMWPSCSRAATV